MDIEIDPQAQTVIFRGEGKAEHRYRRGDVIGESYQLIDLIGQGGMGVVYRVKHLILEKQFALKLLAPDQINNQNWRRFELEGRSLAKLNHRNIVSIYNMGIDQGCPYFVMDLLTGISLAEQIKNYGPLSEKENLDVYLQVCAGLSCAHRNGIIHRDIKPGNIMLLPSERSILVKIVDFGLVRLQSSGSATSQALTTSGEVFGSPYYMSPEQTLGEEIDARSDIYSLGCSLFESLTGQVPFAGASAIETLMMHQEAEAPSPSSLVSSRQASAGHLSTGNLSAGNLSAGNFTPHPVANSSMSAAFDEVVARCLQKEKKLRYQSAEQLAIDLQRIADGKPIGSGALDHQRLRQNSEIRTAVSNHYEGDEEIDNKYAQEQNHSSNFFSSHKLALGLASIASTIIVVAAAYFTITSNAGPAKKPVILKDATNVSLGIADEVAFKINDQVRGIREIASEDSVNDSTKDSSKKDGEPGNETLFLLAEHAAKEPSNQKQTKQIDNAPKFSLGIKKIKGVSMRCFKFPSQLSIGKLRFENRHAEGQGDVKVPADAVIDLHLRPISAQCPSVIDKFAPDDISTLRVEDSNVVGEIARRLSKWTKIHALTIDGGKIKDVELDNLDNIKGLDFLWLKRLSFSGAAFARLNLLKHLHVLQVEDCPQLNQILQNLPIMPELTTLRLEARGDNWLESKSIAALAKQPKLQLLELKSKNENIDTYPPSEGLANKAKLNNKLPIYDWRNQLAELKNLQVLFFEKPDWKREQIAEFLHLVPAARQNHWASAFGYSPKSHASQNNR